MQPKQQFDRALILNIVLIMEGVLLLISTVWCQISQIALAPSLIVRGRYLIIGGAAGIGLSSLSTIFYWVSLKLPWQWSKGIVDLIADLADKFRGITILDVFAMSVASGFCEEVFFRGVLQQQFGLLGANILFGILHGPDSLQYGLWAFVAGLFLGWLYIWSHSLWVPITAHIVNNILGLLLLRYIGRKSAASA